jgi:alkylation response protein AidB-like acyl-CoA dehydrogenase
MVAQAALAQSAEQAELREAVRRLLREKAPLSGLREAADAESGPVAERSQWDLLVEMGLVALGVPEKYDGLGQTALETCVVFEELGRGLYHGPYLSTAGLAVPALLAAADESANAALLPALAAGGTATLAVDPAAEVTAAPDGSGGWTLTGVVPVLLDGADADLLLVAARTGDDLSLFSVDGDAEGLTATRLESLDLARSLARVEFDGTPARPVGTPGAAPEVLERALEHGRVALAAEQAGGAWACLDMCVEYAGTREQFGRPIGSFQAVAHKCVDMLRRVEFGRAAARYAAAALAEGAADTRESGLVAAAYCGEAFREVAVETVQVHGGTGFTWEHDTHLYYRRAWSSQQLLGGTAGHELALADLVLGTD